MIIPGQQAIAKFISANASTILTGVGVAGTVSTAMLTVKATIQAMNKIDDERGKRIAKAMTMNPEAREEIKQTVELSTKDKIKLVAPYYIPPVLSGTATITAIVMANRISASRAAALAAAYTLSENRYKEYREKVQERLTGPKAQAIDDSIAQDRVNTDPPPTNLVVIEGEVLMKDKLTGRYFHSTVEKIRQGERAVNEELALSQYASLSEFYDRIGLEKTQFTDLVGWTTTNGEAPLEVKLSTTMTPDGRPCIVIDFNYIPRPDAHKLY